MEKVITVVGRFAQRCKHNKFIVDPQLGVVKCGICGESLNPMWVLEQYASGEHRLIQQVERLRRLVEETKDKTKCKCQHCGKMTTIANKDEVRRASYS
ncbi:hypothetical protein [Vibrio barjaei]|uniref:hypothetical protein n=1 Tax=Vibrio barjaei TaxID=1676683 RepID=UPI002284F8EF|nr:hypothetical protein [Vibrio barjaei]MCY9874521.1 hypothetical protein [Vibrio barjaei]